MTDLKQKYMEWADRRAMRGSDTVHDWASYEAGAQEAWPLIEGLLTAGAKLADHGYMQNKYKCWVISEAYSAEFNKAIEAFEKKLEETVSS